MLCSSYGAAQSDALRNLSTFSGSGASSVLLEVGSGRVLAREGEVEAPETPGSTVKPFVLRAALQAGVVNERTTVHCAGTLRIAGHNLACVHPRDVTVLDARQALAESCNTYFATVARRMTAKQMVGALHSAGLKVDQGSEDALGEPYRRELTGLGLVGVTANVRQMAEAYRGLALWMAGADAAARAVQDGMVSSVETGAARAAFVPGRTVAGKTGTVDVGQSGRSHGWFAGVVYEGSRPSLVVVVYVPNGNGRDAAALARQVLAGRR